MHSASVRRRSGGAVLWPARRRVKRGNLLVCRGECWIEQDKLLVRIHACFDQCVQPAA